MTSLNEMVYGCGCWWGRIKSPDDVKGIDDAELDNVWYVKALKELDKKKGEDE